MSGNLRSFGLPLAGAATACMVLLTGTAQAAYNLTIGAANSAHVSCASGVCQAIGPNALLNLTTLENFLASGSVQIETGTGGTQAGDITVSAALSWTSSSTLALDAFHSIHVNQPISDAGPGQLTLTTNDGGIGGELSFGRIGNITFFGTSNALTINGSAYALVSSLSSLASAVTANPWGNFALANSYDASADGTYASAPVGTTFLGVFEGLGNTISNLAILDKKKGQYVGLFAQVGGTGAAFIENVRLAKVQVHGTGDVGGLTGLLAVGSELSKDVVTGRITGGAGTIAGGMVGASSGVISESVSSANVSGPLSAGGLAGLDGGSVVNSYANGPVTGGFNGGLVGWASNDTVTGSYSSGRILVSSTCPGGLIGFHQSPSGTSGTYWDTTTSGQNQGFGCGTSDGGITALTTTQLQAGLPAGFDNSIWGENPNLNGGLPYLLNSPPL